MKTREFERYLVQQGCMLEKKVGDHAVYRLPNGRRMDVPRGGRHSDAKGYLLSRFEKLMAGGECTKGRFGSNVHQTQTKP